MDYGKIKSPNKFRIEIAKARKIKSTELQLNRLNLIQLRIHDLIKVKRKVKLLSSKGDKRILAVLEEIYKENKVYLERFKKNNTTIKNIIENKTKPENLRVKSDYIEWHGTKDELLKLLNALVEKEYIIDMSKLKIRTAIKQHFCIGEYQREVKEVQPKMKWGNTKPLLVHLFDVLYNKGYVTEEFYNSKYKKIADHFLSKEGTGFSNKKLKDEYDQGLKTKGAYYSGAPIGHGPLEKLIKDTLEGK